MNWKVGDHALIAGGYGIPPNAESMAERAPSISGRHVVLVGPCPEDCIPSVVRLTLGIGGTFWVVEDHTGATFPGGNLFANVHESCLVPLPPAKDEPATRVDYIPPHIRLILDDPQAPLTGPEGPRPRRKVPA